MSSLTELPADVKNFLPHYHPLVLVLAAVCTGIVIDSYLPQPFVLWWMGAMVLLALWLTTAIRGCEKVGAVLLAFSLLAIGGTWHHLHWNLFDANDLGLYAHSKAQPIELEGIVLRAPRLLSATFPKAPPRYLMEISAQAIRDAGKWKPVSGIARVYVLGEMRPLKAGDQLRIFGRFSTPTEAHNPGEFDRAAFLRRRRVLTQINVESADCISTIRSGSSWRLLRWLERIRTRCSALLRQYLDQRQAELAAAVLLGERELIDNERSEAFMATGTIHILAISGLHVGILAGGLLWLMRFVPIARAWKLLIVALIICLYALMVDIRPPVVRATILILVMCASLYFGRMPLGYNTLAAAALVVLAMNPCDLFSLGAQLSFLAVASIIWIWPRRKFPIFPIVGGQDNLQKMAVEQMNVFFRRLWRLRRFLWDLLLFGAVIWFVTEPLVMARFHICSPAALVLNVFLWLPMALGLLGGFAFLFVAMIAPPLACVAAFFCNS
ncbi:MAG: ComEC/Rec2 family competence protein, partial [Thermoguttaceae bacterium]